MLDLRQQELKEWQIKNFGHKEILPEHLALGMAEEVGEVCHHVLKGVEGIRGGVDGINKTEVADGIADTIIFGIQLFSHLGMDAEVEISKVIDKVLQRNWVDDPSGENTDKPIQHMSV